MKLIIVIQRFLRSRCCQSCLNISWCTRLCQCSLLDVYIFYCFHCHVFFLSKWSLTLGSTSSLVKEHFSFRTFRTNFLHVFLNKFCSSRLFLGKFRYHNDIIINILAWSSKHRFYLLICFSNLIKFFNKWLLSYFPRWLLLF